ncbi:MAG: ABC transporter permease [Bacteroidota bacterium]|nr:ABC transporter permease [Bacteroidota bacterium]
MRHLTKNKAFSFINIFGLSVGLACCLLIVLYLYNELAYDSYHRNVKRLYQVGGLFVTDGKQERYPASPAVMARNMKQDFPEIEETARMMTFSFFGESQTLLQITQPDGRVRSFYEPRGSAADHSLFSLFTYQFTEGDSSRALSGPNEVVISSELAAKIFGGEPAVGKTIRISSSLNGVHDCRVTGVFKPNDRPSHIDAQFMISFYGGSIEDRMRSDGNNMAFDNLYTTYLLLKPGADPGKLEAKFPAFIDKYAGKDFKEAGLGRIDFLLPVKDIHLHADMMEMTPSGSVTYLYILGSIAAFVLLIACINFMNLSTARSSRRSSEVGVRKVLGAGRGGLIRQFLGESLLMAGIAFVVALVLVILLLPAFDLLTGRSIALSPSLCGSLLLFFFGLSVGAGLLAGSYPAFYLSSFLPVEVLKGRFSNSLAAVSLRKGLVIFQFVIAVTLIVMTFVISGQMRFLRGADLGFAKDRQLVIPLRSEVAKRIYPSLKKELARDPRVLSVGASAYYPGIANAGSDNFHKEGQGVSAGQMVRINHVDEDWLNTLGIKPVAGRLFAKEYVASDTGAHVIINEDAVRKIGFASPQDAIGKKLLSVYKGIYHADEIVGVVKDFHYEDLHMPITPYAFYLNAEAHYNYAVAHVGAGDVRSILHSIESSWHALNPGEPFTYSWLDQDFQRNYASEERLSRIVNYFTLVAILISCLGLFGLSSFSAEQRSKEISIRKVLGAGVPGLVALLTKDFLKLVALAVLIACPIAWMAMNTWLQGFTARIPIGWGVFAFTAAMVLVIAFATISVQVIRVALANPVKNLKNE